VIALRILGMIGRTTRRRSAFILQIAALFWGVLREGVRPATWPRTLRSEFRATLTRVVAGSLGTTVVMAIIIGVALVFEALYWLRTAGQETQTGRILVLVLFRELTPLLVGIVVLGRGGNMAVSELGMLTAGGEVATLRAEGIDAFQYLVLPRAVAFALAGFVLGMVFVTLALISGYVTAGLFGVNQNSIFGFLENVLRAMTVGDFVIFPAKLVLIGLMVALTCCATGLAAQEFDSPSNLLPRAFTRGITAVLAVTLLLSTVIS
jgi:phospholipid/cholesterol/gamma-HCH transport system permease protein